MLETHLFTYKIVKIRQMFYAFYNFFITQTGCCLCLSLILKKLRKTSANHNRMAYVLLFLCEENDKLGITNDRKLFILSFCVGKRSKTKT